MCVWNAPLFTFCSCWNSLCARLSPERARACVCVRDSWATAAEMYWDILPENTHCHLSVYSAIERHKKGFFFFFLILCHVLNCALTTSVMSTAIRDALHAIIVHVSYYYLMYIRKMYCTVVFWMHCFVYRLCLYSVSTGANKTFSIFTLTQRTLDCSTFDLFFFHYRLLYFHLSLIFFLFKTKIWVTEALTMEVKNTL